MCGLVRSLLKVINDVFSRWLHNCRINVQKLYSPLIAQALAEWGESSITLIEDTSMLWEEYCLIRLSVHYRGWGVPLVWRMIRHGSSSVRFEVYQAMLKRATRLLPPGVSVCFLADRGFADTTLIGYLRDELKWHFRFGSNATVGFIALAKAGYNSTNITWHSGRWCCCTE